MPKRAILYIGVVICSGAVSLLAAAMNWRMEDPRLFAGVVALAIVLSAMKITLPKMTGTLSAGFVAVLAGVALLSSGEAVVVAGVSGVVQCIWRARVRPTLVQVAFNGATLSLSALAAYHVGHWALAGSGAVSMLGIAAVTDYVINTVLISVVLCLIEGAPLPGIFRNCNFWALPYYFAGVLILHSMVSVGFAPAWCVVLPTLPAMWAVYDYYRGHVAAMARR